MYLAPLNYDRFFKKVFKDTRIAKAFLEDFLATKIESINKLDERHRITDKSKVVEFDYRCKIEDRYVIIDMQQWYKPDVSQRFYIYHALNASLQLEDIRTKAIPIVELSGGEAEEAEEAKKAKEIKDYRLIEPVITLIWLVDDNLDFVVDYVSYKLLPEAVARFIEVEELWYKEDFVNLLAERNKLIKMIKNRCKEIDFLGKNRLVFMFQRNIVKNMEAARREKKVTETKYWRWFDFADRTLKKDNIREDFIEYERDVLFREIIGRLEQAKLTKEEREYITEQSIIWEKVSKYGRDFFDMGKIEGEMIGIEKGEKIGIKKGKKEGEKIGIKKGKKEITKQMLTDGFSIEMIQKYTGLTIEEIEKLK